VRFPVGLNAPGGSLVIVLVLLPVSGNVAEGGHSPLGIHVSLPPGRPGSQGVQLTWLLLTQYPVGE